jgi:hypothetical protein
MRSRIPVLVLATVLGCALACATFGRAVTWHYATPPVATVVNSTNVTTPGQITAAIAAPGSGRMAYIEGFDVTGGGATSASVINCTVTGTTNTLNFSMNIASGVTASVNAQGGLFIRFPTPIPASATNTAITLTVPSFGTGNTEASCTVYGFSQ